MSLNPQLRGMVDLNPQLREMMQNPELLRQLTNPETMQVFSLSKFYQNSLTNIISVSVAVSLFRQFICSTGTSCLCSS